MIYITSVQPSAFNPIFLSGLLPVLIVPKLFLPSWAALRPFFIAASYPLSVSNYDAYYHA